MNILERIFGKPEKEYSNRRSDSLLKQNAIDKTQKLETIEFNINNETIQNIMENSEFPIVRQKLGALTHLKGSAILMLLPFRNTYIIDALQTVSYRKVGKFIIEMTGWSGAMQEYNGEDYNLYTKLWFNENNKVELARYIIDEDNQEIIIGEKFIYKGLTELPGQLFFNNNEMESDIDFFDLCSAIENLDYYDAKLRSEWERTRTMPYFNTTLTDNDPKQTTNDIDDGKGFIKEDGFNAKYGAGTTMLPATAGTTILQQQIVFLEDDIKAKLGMHRDTVNSGSNQHHMELMMADEYAMTMIDKLKVIRQSQWNLFFDKIAKALGQEINLPQVSLSEIEQAKRDLLKSVVLEAQVKAQNISSQGDNNE